jgi:hypothetical protein
MFGIPGLDNIVKSFVSQAIDIAAPMALNAIFPGLGTMLGPVVADIAKDMLKTALNEQLSQMGRDGTMPKFLVKIAQDILGKVVDDLKQPVDQGCKDFVQDKCGSSLKSAIDDLMKDFKNALTQYLDDCSKKGKPGKGGGCGTGGAGGAGGNGGQVGFRELAAILAELESKQAKNVKDAVIKASEALGVPKTEGKTKEDLQTNATIEADQFKAMENSKAEAQIFQALASAISEVMKNFGGALNTSARGG